ncbi:hypothetical protein N7528_007864 [Penicillium herquei]|nr:hypothetical protein N7528_007864 [Penicillium herquei]
MSYQNDSQAFHPDLNSHDFSHNSLPLTDHSQMAGTAPYRNNGQYSPKHPVQMEDIYSVPGGSSSIPQSGSWTFNFDIPPQASFQSWTNSGIEASSDVKMNLPSYEAMDISDDGMNFDPTPTSLQVTINKDDKSFETWRDNGFRFYAVLGAPTAMSRNIKDPTLTYLNKGQAYKLSILDSKPQVVDGQTTKYRTFVRVTFDQDTPRSNPTACWQLWREARTLKNNAQKEQVESFPLAVEFAGPVGSNFRYQIEQESFDGFCITWEMDSVTSSNFCNILLRLHFLSTDFTRSKGVKGMPIRLCVKTQELASSVDFLHPGDPEICFCKIQLFRDHGAERKMSNDNGNLTRAIEKLKQKISNSAPQKVTQKRRRVKPSALADEALGSMIAPKFEIQQLNNDGMDLKLVELERMSLLTQPRTILALRGSKEDDPDLYPVRMPDYQESDISSEISPMDNLTTTSNHSDSELTSIDTNDGGGKAEVHRMPVDHRQRIGSTSSAVSSEQLFSPVACFYIRLMLESSQQFYRAIYLSERTTNNLAHAISRKYGITLTDELNIFHVGYKNIKVLVDDGFVEQIPEGQHMGIQLDENASLDGKTKFCAMRLLY